MSVYIIPDEWLIYDLKGENGKEKQREAFKFLESVEEKCDSWWFLR